MNTIQCPEGAEVIFRDTAGVAVYAMNGVLVITNGKDEAQTEDTREARECFIEDAKAIVRYLRESTGLCFQTA